ncbi:unnamed protein product [Spirodela intermedia]|uniref:Uncharacterized protein n=1 Tax=Spirodela intermedia TaxID=51605 RepID=A0A7I8IPL8_SPIIN|nr:unnamed protein product [Spirodela intermedia]CAA6659889.1 unnamed protein product [Spirodela intermedia]
MGVLGERSCCFCSGGGGRRGLRLASSLERVPPWPWCLVAPPSVAAAEAADIQIHQGRISARLVPHRFFITSTVLDLTIVGIDPLEADSNSQQPHCLKTGSIPSLELASVVYLLGYDDRKELMVGEGKIAVATDNLIKLSTGVTWCPGSAGFDVQGNLAFMVCDPMKLASSPTLRSSSVSSSSSTSAKKDLPMQFGIPIPIIMDWLDRSGASFTMRRVFKDPEAENDAMTSSSAVISRLTGQLGSAGSASPRGNAGGEQDHPRGDLRSTHDRGIRVPKIYETPKVTSGPLLRKDHPPLQLLDINFPPKLPRAAMLPLPVRQMLTESHRNQAKAPRQGNSPAEAGPSRRRKPRSSEDSAEVTQPCPALADCHSEVQSSSSPLAISVSADEGYRCSSDGRRCTLRRRWRAETMPEPQLHGLPAVGRRSSDELRHRKSWAAEAAQSDRRKEDPAHSQSQTVPAGQKNHIYHSPTVSSAMKKRGGAEQRTRPRRTVAQVSPRWMF